MCEGEEGVCLLISGGCGPSSVGTTLEGEGLDTGQSPTVHWGGGGGERERERERDV